jgi:hypothetical protein
MQTEHDPSGAEEPDREEEEPAEGLEGERDWFQSVGPEPGPGDSDGGGWD